LLKFLLTYRLMGTWHPWAIDLRQQKATGCVRAKGNAAIIGRKSSCSLYDQDLVTFEEDKVAYDHRDAGGFIKLDALRPRGLPSATPLGTKT